MHDWSILVFTICYTAGVGLMGAVTLSGILLKQKLGPSLFYSTTRDTIVLGCILAALGLAASFGHLGYPLNAPNAIRHVATSALSREIVLASAFIGAACLTALISLRAGRVPLVAVVGCFVIGLLSVWFMGDIYRNASVVTWMHVNTHVMLFGGLVLMGAIVGFVLIGPKVARIVGFSGVLPLLGWTTALVLIGIAAQLAVLPSYVTAIHANPMNAVVTYALHPLEIFQSQTEMRLLRWLVSFAGAALLLCAAWRALRDKESSGFTLTFTATVLLLAGEIVGRYLFYTIYA